MPTPADFETDRAVRELLELVGGMPEHVMAGPHAIAADDHATALEGYRWMFSLLRAALDAHVWADPAAPRLVDIVGPYEKWGGDNADAFYQHAGIDPGRTYRVTGRPGDAVYWSLTVYGGPRDGHYSDRIVGSLNDEHCEVGPDGTIEMVLAADDPGDGTPWLELADDAVCAVTRDYLADPRTGRRMGWEIATTAPGGPAHPDDAELARRFRAAATFVRDQLAFTPLPAFEANTVADPYPVPTETIGWAAGDAAYAMGAFELGEEEALVLRGSSPPCRFWNLCLWNPLLHTYSYDHGRVTLNGHQVSLEPDGSWEIVIAGRDPGRPNWVDTQGHASGRLWFRWFLPDHTPERPVSEVVALSTLSA